MMTFDPRHSTLERWSAMTAALLSNFGTVPTSTDKDRWREWGQSVRNLPALAALGIPDPRLFEDWEQWAFRLNQSLSSVT